MEEWPESGLMATGQEDSRRPTTSSSSSRGLHSRGRPSTQDQLQISQMNLAAALLDAAAKGSRLTEGQKAEVPRACPAPLALVYLST